MCKGWPNIVVIIYLYIALKFIKYFSIIWYQNAFDGLLTLRWFHSGRKKTEHLNICLNSLYSFFVFCFWVPGSSIDFFVSTFFSSSETQLWWSDFNVRTADASDYRGSLGSAWNSTKLFFIAREVVSVLSLHKGWAVLCRKMDCDLPLPIF